MIVLDTNVVSELMRQTPAQPVLDWVRAQSAGVLCTTSVTLAEVRYGIARLPEGRRKGALRAAADDVFSAFADRVIAFDAVDAAHYADIAVARADAGIPISGFDAQIAAVCRHHRAALATRNIDDFKHLALDLVDPWARDESQLPAEYVVRP